MPACSNYVVLGIVTFCTVLMGLLINSPLGLSFKIVRENARRAGLIGVNVYRVRLTAFVIAGALAGASGALFAFFGRYASASYMFYDVSGEAVVWAIVGGSGTLLGPLFGTGALIILREVVSGFSENYLAAMGAITVMVVMFAPQGLAGAWTRLLTSLPLRDHLVPPAPRGKVADREQSS
jgi:branched-chain amino acid transport system permease protein